MQETATNRAPSPSPTDQRIRLVLEAEIFQDPEGGPDSLIATTDQLACEPVVPARLRRMVAEARAQLDAIERLADVHEAEDTLAAMIAEHDLTLIEVDFDGLAHHDPEMADRPICWVAKGSDGRQYVVVPEGQDPIDRTDAIAKAVASLAVRA